MPWRILGPRQLQAMDEGQTPSLWSLGREKRATEASYPSASMPQIRYQVYMLCTRHRSRLQETSELSLQAAPRASLTHF